MFDALLLLVHKQVELLFANVMFVKHSDSVWHSQCDIVLATVECMV